MALLWKRIAPRFDISTKSMSARAVESLPACVGEWGSNGGGCSLLRVWVRPIGLGLGVRARAWVRPSIIHLLYRLEEARSQATEKERRRYYNLLVRHCDNLLVRCRA